MNKEKWEHYSHIVVALLGIVLIGYIFVKYIFALTLPFLIAWGVAFSIRPLAKKISGGTRLPYKLISVILTLFIVLGSIAVIVSACTYAVGEAWDFLANLGKGEKLYDVLSKILNPLKEFFSEREDGAELESKVLEAISSALTSLLTRLLEGVTSFVVEVPKVLIFTLVTLIASIYFAYDLERINGFVKSHLPKKAAVWLVNFKNKFLSSLLKYLRAYLIIMLITFIIMLFGFLVLGVKYAVLLAFIVALLDALPLIGVGTIIVPWSIYQIFFGKFSLGMGLLILFIVHEVLREFIEPKIVGKHLGLHPIISLILLYVGYFAFGFFGLLLIPLLSVIINILINKDDSPKVN